MPNMQSVCICHSKKRLKALDEFCLPVFLLFVSFHTVFWWVDLDGIGGEVGYVLSYASSDLSVVYTTEFEGKMKIIGWR